MKHATLRPMQSPTSSSLPIAEELEVPPVVKALCEAAREGSLDKVRELCGQGVDVNHPDGDSTALHCAAAGGHLEVVRCLLLAKATPDAPLDPWYEDSMGGGGALHCAARNGHQEVAELLLSHGESNVNKRCWFPSLLTPLHVAVVEGHLGVARVLLNAKADVTMVTGPGEGEKTVLEFAELTRDEKMMELLRSHRGV